MEKIINWWTSDNKLSEEGKRKITECYNLDILFEYWKEAHKQENLESLKRTLPIYPADNDKRIEWFTKDGAIGLNSSKTKVLFICREAHIENVEEIFWFRDYAVKEKKTKYYNCAQLCLKQLGIIADDIKKCAYMNINKRGGKNSCNLERLAEYAKCYEDFIKKEIELLNPEIIILLGKMDYKGIIYDIVKSSCNPETQLWLYPRHPSVYSKKIDIIQLNDVRHIIPVEARGFTI